MARTNTVFYFIILAVSALSCVASPVWADTTTSQVLYDMQDLGLPPNSSTFNAGGLSINENDEIAGYGEYNDNSQLYGILYDPTSATFIEPSPYDSSGITDFSEIEAINDRGDFAGYGYDDGSGVDDILFSPARNPDGTFPSPIDISAEGDPGRTWQADSVGGLNNLDQVVGYYIDSNDIEHGYLWDGAFHAVAAPAGYTLNSLTGINDQQTYVGNASTASEITHVFIGTPQGAPQDIGTLLGLANDTHTSYGEAINTSGQIVGFSDASDGTTHAFLWTPGGTDGAAANPQMKDLGTLSGAADSYATGINAAGTVVGYCDYQSSSDHAWFWDKTHGMVDLNQSILTAPAGAPAFTVPSSPYPITYPYAISTDGEIVALVTDSANNTLQGLYVLAPALVQQTHTDNLSFKTSGQNLWAGDQATNSFNFSYHLGPPDWNLDLFQSQYLFDPCFGGWHVSLGFFSFDIPQICLGNFGYKAGIYTNGHAGIDFTASASTGSVNVSYPVSVNLSFPDKNSIHVNDVFPVTATYTVDNAASLVTTPPSAQAKLTAVLKENSSCGADLYAFGQDVYSLNLVPPALQSLNLNYDIFNTGNLLGNGSKTDYYLPSQSEPIVSGYYKIPQLDADGGLAQPGGTQLTASAQDTFVTANGHLTDLISEIFDIPLSDGFNFDIGHVNYNLLDLRLTADLVAHQDFSFQGAPHVHLVFDQPVIVGTTPAAVLNSTQTVTSYDLDAVVPGSQPDPPSQNGQPGTIWIQMPGSNSDPTTVRMKVTPTFSLPPTTANNTFTTNTYVQANVGFGFVPLEIAGGANVAGWSLGSFDFVPINFSTSFPVGTIPIHSDAFSLGGFNQKKGTSFNIAGLVYPSPVLKSVSPATLPIFIAQATNPSVTDYGNYQQFVTGSGTTLMITGRNFTSTTRAYYEINGQKMSLPTTYLNTARINVILPNILRLLPGTGRLSCTDVYTPQVVQTDNPIILNSNDLDFDVVYPTPAIGTVGPNIWASDPNFENVPLTVTDQRGVINGVPTDTFIKRIDYYRILQNDFWPRSSPQPMNLFFPGFDFSIDAELPSMLWDNQPLASYREPIPSGLLWSILPVSYYDYPRQSAVQIVAAGPGGGASNNVIHTVGALQPVISMLAPNTVVPGSGQFRLTLKGPDGNPIPGDTAHTGGNFNGGSEVSWNGTLLTPIFVSSSELQVDVPANLAAASGSVNVSVVNPGATDTQGVVSDTSAPAVFQVANPSPTIALINPASVVTNDPDFAQPGNMTGSPSPYNLDITGTGFVTGTQVTWTMNGTTTILQTQFVSSAVIQAIVPLYLVQAAGTATITVTNPLPIYNPMTGAAPPASVTGTVTIADAVPGTDTATVNSYLQISTPAGQMDATGQSSPPPPLNPSVVDQNTPGFTLDIQGSGFCADTVVNFNGTPLTAKPTLISFNEITVAIPAGDLTQAGTAAISVTNTGSGSGTSNAMPLTIAPSYLLNLGLSTSAVTGSHAVTGTVTLASAAPVGTAIILSSSSSIASFASVSGGGTVVSNGDGTDTLTLTTAGTIAQFSVTTQVVTGATPVVITASKSGRTAQANLTVNPPSLVSFTVSPNPVTEGSSATGTLMLDAPPLTPVSVSVSSDNTSVAKVPSGGTVTFPASATNTSATFQITTGASGQTTGTTSLHASYNGAGFTQTLTVNAPAHVRLKSLKIAPAAVGIGGKATGTVTLTGPAPAGGVSIRLTAGDSGVGIPALVTVPHGRSSVNFSVVGRAVLIRHQVVIRASFGKDLMSASLMVEPSTGITYPVVKRTWNP